MMNSLFWIYLVNVVLLILHEKDSTYWKEWNLFHLPGGLTGFLLIHFPLYCLGICDDLCSVNGTASQTTLDQTVYVNA